jgi:hypothetical protein
VDERPFAEQLIVPTRSCGKLHNKLHRQLLALMSPGSENAAEKPAPERKAHAIPRKTASNGMRPINCTANVPAEESSSGMYRNMRAMTIQARGWPPSPWAAATLGTWSGVRSGTPWMPMLHQAAATASIRAKVCPRHATFTKDEALSHAHRVS